MDVLLTFTGFHDPFFKGLVDQEEQPGPVLSLLSARSFDQIYLFNTPGTQSVTEETKGAINSLYPNTRVEILDIHLDDPTDYREILKGLRKHIQQIQETLSAATFFVAVASGTPQMHACWFLLIVFGETGTGKELFSRFIHRLSGRPKGAFVAVNCAAIPEDLVKSLLFGHKKGAFTGAIADQVGKFDAADQDTLFLDEFGELPLPAQAKLLRVLQDGLVEPIGATKPHKVDVRVIGATNRDLRNLIRQGRFREDLLYRLNVGEVKLPPLRERRSDIPKLALHILDRINGSLRRPKRLSPEGLSTLQAHSWPGNIRDLENVIERFVRLCRRDVLETDDLLITEPVTYIDPLDALLDPCEGFSLDEFLSSAQKQLILRALEASKGNQSKAARMLGITPQAVHKFLQQSKPHT